MRLAAFCVVASGISVPLRAQQALVGTLQDPRVVRGCSWSASAAALGAGPVFLAEYDESLIVMNIGGSDVRLELDATSGAGYPRRVGERVTKIYTSGAVRVDATYTAVWVCPPGQEGCEVTRFDVTFIVRRGDRVETVSATAEVGC